MRLLIVLAKACLSLIVVFATFSSYGQQSVCERVQAIKTEVTHTRVGGDGSIKLIIPDGSSMREFKFHLFAPSRSDNKIITELETRRLKKGTYHIIIQSAGTTDCTRQITLEIN